jgi:hypothetical protein
VKVDFNLVGYFFYMLRLDEINRRSSVESFAWPESLNRVDLPAKSNLIANFKMVSNAVTNGHTVPLSMFGNIARTILHCKFYFIVLLRLRSVASDFVAMVWMKL